MQIKTTMRYHLIPIRKNYHQQINKHQVLERMWRKGDPTVLLVGTEILQPVWKTVWIFLKKLKMKLPFDPANPFLGIYSKKSKTLIQNNICSSYSLEH